MSNQGKIDAEQERARQERYKRKMIIENSKAMTKKKNAAERASSKKQTKDFRKAIMKRVSDHTKDTYTDNNVWVSKTKHGPVKVHKNVKIHGKKKKK